MFAVDDVDETLERLRKGLLIGLAQELPLRIPNQ